MLKQNVLFLLLLLVPLAACVTLTEPGATQSKSETVERGDAASARVVIDAALGDLTVAGGATNLLEADFRYNLDELEPIVSYSISGDEGRLTVANQDGEFGIPTGEVESVWDLRLSDEAPMEMDISLGLGDSNLDLGDLSLTNLDVNAGAGRLNLDVGSQTLDRLHVEAGLGDVEMHVAGGAIGRFDFQSGAGSNEIDLRGSWEEDLVATIEGGLGDLTLIVPEDVGVRIDVDLGLGDVRADGFRVDGDAYVNDAYEAGADVTLSINVQGGAGQITLEQGE